MNIPDYTTYKHLNTLARADREEQAKMIAEDTEAYLKNGGTITKVPYNPVDELMDMGGRWVLMGEGEYFSEDDDFDGEVESLFEPYV